MIFIVEGTGSGSIDGLDAVLNARTGGVVIVKTTSTQDSARIMAQQARKFAGQLPANPTLEQIIEAGVQAFIDNSVAEALAHEKQVAADAAIAGVPGIVVT
jgi:hypothetical protein